MKKKNYEKFLIKIIFLKIFVNVFVKKALLRFQKNLYQKIFFPKKQCIWNLLKNYSLVKTFPNIVCNFFSEVFDNSEFSILTHRC